MAKGSGFSPYSILLAVFLLGSAVGVMTGCASGKTPANLNHHVESVSGSDLYRAAAAGDFDTVSKLVESGVPLNGLTESGTPLMAAVQAGADRVVWYLLSQGAS